MWSTKPKICTILHKYYLHKFIYKKYLLVLFKLLLNSGENLVLDQCSSVAPCKNRLKKKTQENSLFSNSLLCPRMNFKNISGSTKKKKIQH